MSVFEKKFFNPDAMLSETEIHRIGNPLTYDKYRDQVETLIDQICAVSVDAYSDHLDSQNNLLGRKMKKKEFTAKLDEFTYDLRTLCLALESLNKTMNLCNVIANGEAMVWYPPTDVYGAALPHDTVKLDVEPFSYMEHLQLRPRAKLDRQPRWQDNLPDIKVQESVRWQKWKRIDNPAIYDNALIMSRDTYKCDEIYGYSAGQASDLDRAHLIAMEQFISQILEKYGPYLKTQGADCSAVSALLRKPQFQVSHPSKELLRN